MRLGIHHDSNPKRVLQTCPSVLTVRQRNTNSLFLFLAWRVRRVVSVGFSKDLLQRLPSLGDNSSKLHKRCQRSGIFQPIEGKGHERLGGRSKGSIPAEWFVDLVKERVAHSDNLLDREAGYHLRSLLISSPGPCCVPFRQCDGNGKSKQGTNSLDPGRCALIIDYSAPPIREDGNAQDQRKKKGVKRRPDHRAYASKLGHLPHAATIPGASA